MGKRSKPQTEAIASSLSTVIEVKPHYPGHTNDFMDYGCSAEFRALSTRKACICKNRVTLFLRNETKVPWYRMCIKNEF